MNDATKVLLCVIGLCICGLIAVLTLAGEPRAADFRRVCGDENNPTRRFPGTRIRR